MNLKIKNLMGFFAKHNALYLIVGGYAVMKYCKPKFKKSWIYG